MQLSVINLDLLLMNWYINSLYLITAFPVSVEWNKKYQNNLSKCQRAVIKLKHFNWNKNLNTDLHNASPRDIWRKYTIFNYSIYLFWYFRDRGRQRKLIKELINTLTKESIEKKVHNLEHASSKLWAQLGTLQFQVVRVQQTKANIWGKFLWKEIVVLGR